MSISQSCAVEWCDKDYEFKGFCSRHYRQQLHGKNPNIKNSRDYRPHVIENGICKIPLGLNAKDGYTIVDKEYSFLDKYNWSLVGHGYAKGQVDGRVQYIHRVVLGYDGINDIDHINGDPLDNRFNNLRIATKSQNSVNRGLQSNNTLGYKGLVVVKNRLYVRFIYKRKIYYGSGSFNSVKEAAAEYNRLALLYCGEFAKLNIID